MKVAVMGSGAVGGYLGGRLIGAGIDVALIARGAHLQAMRRDGLRIESARGDIRARARIATDDASEVGVVDYVVFAVKSHDTDRAARQLAPMIGEKTAVITFQNGVDNADRIGRAIGERRVLDGICYAPLVIAAHGVIRHTGPVNRYVFGEIDGALTPRAERFRDAGLAGGLDMVLTDAIETELWTKFVMVAAFSAVTALTRLPLGPIIAVPETARLYERAMAEVAAVAKAKSIALPADIVARNLEFSRHVADPATRSSMLEDLERGRPIELAALSGHVSRLGRALDVATPVHDVAYAALKPHAAGRPPGEGGSPGASGV